MVIRRCAARTCYNTTASRPHMKFFFFPRDETQIRLWAEACERPDIVRKGSDLKSKYVLCAEHFEDRWFADPDKKTILLKQEKPVPSIFINNIREYVPARSTSSVSRENGSVDQNETQDAESNSKDGSEKEGDLENQGIGVQSFVVQNEGISKTVKRLIWADVVIGQTEKEVYNACRMCAHLIQANQLVSMYDMYLDVQFNKLMPRALHSFKDDGLPDKVCNDCVDKLMTCANTIQQFINADMKLKALIHTQVMDMQSPLNRDSTTMTIQTLPLPMVRPGEAACEDENSQSCDFMQFIEINDEKELDITPEKNPEVENLRNARVITIDKTKPRCAWNLKEQRLNIPILDQPSKDSTPKVSPRKKRTNNSTTATAKIVTVNTSEVASSDDREIESEASTAETVTAADSDLRVTFPKKWNEAKVYKCIECTEEFTSKSIMVRHSLIHHAIEGDKHEVKFVLLKRKRNYVRNRSKKYKCSRCHVDVVGNKAYQAHLKLHSTVSNVCEYCGKRFVQRNRLESHRKMHFNDRPFVCNTCGDTFFFSNSLTRHKKCHDAKPSQKCDKCDASFSTKLLLKKHDRKEHKEENRVLCNICGKVLASSKSLKDHITTHYEDRPYACPVCSKSFKTGTQLSRHKATHKKEKRFECKLCDKKFHLLRLLKQHMITHSGTRPHVCETCGARFNRAGNLGQHKKKHLQPKEEGVSPSHSLTCIKCGKRLRNRKSMIYHMSRHTGEKPHTCDSCDKRFMTIAQLRIHSRLHTGERPYKCEECGKSFRADATMKQHYMSLHTDQFPYECSYCARKFKRLHSLIVHQRTHTGERPYPCTICGRAFSQKGDMMKHTRIHDQGYQSRTVNKDRREPEDRNSTTVQNSEVTETVEVLELCDAEVPDQNCQLLYLTTP